jgi:hypothetical protein
LRSSASAFCGFGHAFLLVFFLTSTKLTFFVWWCLHGGVDHGDGGHHFLVCWSLVLFLALVMFFSQCF